VCQKAPNLGVFFFPQGQPLGKAALQNSATVPGTAGDSNGTSYNIALLRVDGVGEADMPATIASTDILPYGLIRPGFPGA